MSAGGLESGVGAEVVALPPVGAMPGAEPPDRLSAELQVTYATGVVAATLAAAWQILTYGRDSCFSSPWEMYLAAFIVVLLELVTCGMAISILYRGFWIAMRLLAETRTDARQALPAELLAWDADIRGIDAACQALFYRTFRILYAGLIWGTTLLGFGWAQSDNVVTQSIGKAVVAVAVLSAVARWLARRLSKRALGRLASWLDGALIGFRRRLGFWWFTTDPSPIGRVGWVMLALFGLVAYFFDVAFMLQSRVDSDKAIYLQRTKEPILLTYQHGGFLPASIYEADSRELRVKLENMTSLTRPVLRDPGSEQPGARVKFHRVAPNRYAAVLESVELVPGVVRVRVELKLGYKGEGSKLSYAFQSAETQFLVSP